MCAKKLVSLSAGKTALNGLWLHGEIAIVGHAEIVFSAWLNTGHYAPIWAFSKYLGGANLWILSPSRHTKYLRISLKQRMSGGKRGRLYITRSSEKISRCNT